VVAGFDLLRSENNHRHEMTANSSREEWRR
jgi:hypothetical protein